MKTIHILVSILYLTLSARAARTDLTGSVTGSDGAPLSKAMVLIYTAGPKQGTSSFCPSCYADCSKKAQTDAQGRFEIQSLDPTLVFRLLTVAGGYQSRFLTKVDPAKGETKIVLEPLSPGELNSPLRVKGLVIGEDGQPIANATIGPEGIGIGDGTRWGPTDDYTDPVAVSDDRGRFVMHCKKNVDSIFARAEGRGVAQKWVEFKPGGDYVVRMEEGVSVTGRIVRDGRPLPDVSAGLSSTDRAAGNYLECTPIATGVTGRFLIVNVPPGREFSFRAGMDSLRGRGAVPSKVFTTGRSGTTLDLGDIAVSPGYRVEGRLELSDGQPIPPGTLLLLSRRNARDVSQQQLGPDGSFEFSDVPAEPLGLNVRIKGYKFSKRNPSLDWLNGGIVGKLDRDTTGLILLLEPGEWQFDGSLPLPILRSPASGSRHPEDGPADGNPQPSDKPLRGLTEK